MPVGMKLYHVAFTDQSQPIRPHRQSTFGTHARESFKSGIIYPLMRCVAAHGKNIFIKTLLDMDQCALAWAIAPVLEGGKHDGFSLFHSHSYSN